MTFILIYALSTRNFFMEYRQLLNLPWGAVSLVNLYVGFILFSGWIIYREGSWWQAEFWVFFMMTLGFFTGSFYTFVALIKSKGDWNKFWMGRHTNLKETK